MSGKQKKEGLATARINPLRLTPFPSTRRGGPYKEQRGIRTAEPSPTSQRCRTCAVREQTRR